MSKKSSSTTAWLQANLVRVTRIHFLYIAAYMASIIIFDSWNLLTHMAVSNFWTAAGTLLVINIVLWYIGRIKFSADKIYISALQLLILADITLAGLTIYWQRGIASEAVILFAVPLVIAASLRSRNTILATAALSAAAYSTAAVRYFYEHYGESFRVELWGEIGLYSAVFFVLAILLIVIIRPQQKL